MTGFGAAEGKVAGGRLRVEIRTVNHRYFNPQLKLPYDLAGVEGELRDRLRALLERGHVAVSARWVEQPQATAAVMLDLDRAKQVVHALRELKKRLKLKGEPDLTFVARHPDVLTFSGDGAVVTWADVQPVAERAAADVLAMREREGRALAADLGARLDALEAGARTVATRAPDRVKHELARLQKQVAELAAGVQVDPQRLAVEVALLADRVDISEELVRFQTHLTAVRSVLAGTGAVGKQLGFLAQELLREINTMGSKSRSATIRSLVVELKTEVERIREQVQNVE